jgi:hypothetical protein
MKGESFRPATPIDRLIRAMAEFAVAEYLTEKTASNDAFNAPRPNPVPLPDLGEAA